LRADVADFTSGILPDHSAKTAVILDVLEHVYDPQPTLSALRGRVEQLIISVPNFVSLPARLQVLAGRVPENNTPRKGHVYWYTLDVLRKRLQETGWMIVEIGVNPSWASRPGIGPIMRWFARQWPSLFSLSLVVKARPISSPTV
jgi:hypothetical protein